MEQHLLALDFDGVLCDGLSEYFQTTCQAYRQLWPIAEEPIADAEFESYRSSFYEARPIIESGWEMPVMLRSLVLGHNALAILANWTQIREVILQQSPHDRATYIHAIDRVRDHAIDNELEDWLALHRFYPGIISQLQLWVARADVDVWVVSTKEGRFIDQLLQQAGVNIPRSQIIGKEIGQPKFVTLGQLRDRSPSARITFVEDRIPALEQVLRVPTLDAVRLYLADWGYNTATMRQGVGDRDRIQLLSLETFSQLLP